MRSPDWKNNKKRVLKFLFISFILTFPNILNNIQNSSLAFNDESNQLDIYSSKIDSQLLQIINSKEESQNLPIIVLYNYADEAFKKELEENSNTPIYNYKIIPATSLYLSSDKINSIAKSPAVKRIFLDKKVYPLSFEKTKLGQGFRKPSAQQFPYIPLVNQSLSQIGAPYLWDLDLNGSGVVVAVLDTGIDKTHPDLNDLDDNPSTIDDPKVINESSFIDFNFDGIIDEDTSDNVGHGTHVAGIISGTGEASNYQFKGVAPASELMNVKVLSEYGGYESWIIKGIEYATFGPDGIPDNGDEADIISMSLGGGGFIDDMLIKAVDKAWEFNITVVIAAGNSGSEYFSLDSPGLSSKCITVGAVDSTDSIASFSSRGPSPDLRMGVDICAPGVNIIAPLANTSDSGSEEGNYTTKSGTSMATPFVAGGIALLLQSDPSLTPTAIKTALMTSAVDIGVSSYIQGAGRLDIYGAYNLLNKISNAGEVELKRSNLLDSISLGNTNLYGSFDTPFYSSYFGDYHDNGTYWRRISDIWDMFFAVRYTFEDTPRIFLSSEISKDYPRILRWLVYNYTHKIATESLKTPDNILKIDILYEIYSDSKWVRLSFNLSSLTTLDISNVKFYYFMDADIYGGFQMETESNYDDDAKFLSSINALVANDTYYDERTHPKYGFKPNNFLGFSSPNPSTAFEVNHWSDVYDKMLNGTLTNNTYYRGDVALAQEWIKATLSPTDHTFIPIILAFGHNESDFRDNINVGKNYPFFNLFKSDISINTLTVSNPIYNGTETYLNISLSNIGYSKSSKINITTFVNGIKINKTEINELQTNEETIISIPTTFNRTGVNNVTIISDLASNEFSDANTNNKFQKNLRILVPILASFFPSSPLDNPLQIKYANQFLFWNCSIFQGEIISNLKLNKTGAGKEFFTFNSNPSSMNEINLATGVGQYFINISVNIPKGTRGSYLVFLQLLNETTVLFEVPIAFDLTSDLPFNLLINNTLTEESGLDDNDGILEGDEMGSVSFQVHNNNSLNVYDLFLIVSSKNNSLIEILDYNIYVDFSLKTNESVWSADDFDFSIPYNISDTDFTIDSILFVSLDAENYIPLYLQAINFSVYGRDPGIPDLTLHSVSFNEFIIANDNNILEPGELGYIIIDFRNIGDGSALQIFNTNITCSHSGVYIFKPFFVFLFAFPSIHIQWNSIEPNEVTSNYSSFPFIQLSDSINAGEVLVFQIDIEYCNMAGDLFQETFQFRYTIPLISDGGNGDGDDDDNGEDDMVIILLIITFSSIGAIVAVVAIIIKRRKSAFSRE